jgi:AcrR family transcriptional regulator
MSKRAGVDRAAKILKAADTLFCERGFPGVSMRDVAERADVNKALIFYYYDSKAALFEAVLTRYYEAHAEALKAAGADEGQDPRARCHRLLDGYFDFLDANRRYARLIQSEVARAGEHVGLIRKNLAALFHVIEGTLGDVLPPEGHLSPKHFFLSLSGLTINYYTYAPVVRSFWGDSPMSASARAERREHVHWVVDAMLDKLERA